jgi:hypothetical protein
MSNPLEPTAPIIGLRQWRLTESGDRLRGISADVEWAKGDDEAHEISEGSHDGFHAYAPLGASELGGWASAGWNADTDLKDVYVQITGVVIGWGRVFVHGKGWRSEFVRPIAFASWEAHVKKWEAVYNLERIKTRHPDFQISDRMEGGEEGFAALARYYGVATVDSLSGCVDYAADEGLGVILDPAAHMAAEYEDLHKKADLKDNEAADFRRQADALKAKFAAKSKRSEFIDLVKAANG